MTPNDIQKDRSTDVAGSPLVTDARGRVHVHYAVTNELTLIDTDGTVLDRDTLAPEKRAAYIANVREQVGVETDHRRSKGLVETIADAVEGGT